MCLCTEDDCAAVKSIRFGNKKTINTVISSNQSNSLNEHLGKANWAAHLSLLVSKSMYWTSSVPWIATLFLDLTMQRSFQ